MIQLITCRSCGGFLSLALRACPHCEAPLDRLRRVAVGLAALAGGGAVSLTLMACYGAPCVDDDGGCRGPDASGDASNDANDDARTAAEASVGKPDAGSDADPSDASTDADAELGDGGPDGS